MKWEYFILSLAQDENTTQTLIEEQFDVIGELGWELVAISNRVAYFKRPIP